MTANTFWLNCPFVDGALLLRLFGSGSNHKQKYPARLATPSKRPKGVASRGIAPDLAEVEGCAAAEVCAAAAEVTEFAFDATGEVAARAETIAEEAWVVEAGMMVWICHQRYENR